MSEVLQQAENTIVFKRGIKRFVELCVKSDIKIDIISAALAEPIRHLLDREGLGHVQVWANEMATNADGIIVGVEGPVVGSANKAAFGRPHDGKTLLLGDKPNDRHMHTGNPDDVFAICAGGSIAERLKSKDESNVSRHIGARFEAGFDAITTTGTFLPINMAFKALTRRTTISEVA
jgi:hypothetical protein